MPTFVNTRTGVTHTLPDEPLDGHVVGRAAQWTHLMRVMRDSKRWRRVDSSTAAPSSAAPVAPVRGVDAGSDSTERVAVELGGPPDIADRKQVWFDYAVSQGFTEEYDDVTKAALVDRYGR